MFPNGSNSGREGDVERGGNITGLNSGFELLELRFNLEFELWVWKLYVRTLGSETPCSQSLGTLCLHVQTLAPWMSVELPNPSSR